MVKIFLALSLMITAASTTAQATCVRYCKVGKSKPCGDACIPLTSLCRKDWTRACPDTEKPTDEKQQDIVPKHVEERGA